MKILHGALGLIAIAMFDIGCVSLSCTEIGCNDGISVTVDDFEAALSGKLPATVKLCAGADCATVVISDDNGTLTCADGSTLSQCLVKADGTLELALSSAIEAQVDISIEIKNADGDVLLTDTQSVEAAENKPNGDGCEPTCHNAEAQFTAP